MQNNDVKIRIPHNLIMNDRSKLTVTGVTEVESYDDREILMDTTLGALTITGMDLKIERLSVDEGDISVEGNINSLVYSEIRRRGSIFSKLFG